MRLNDKDFEEMLALFNPEDVPTDPTLARQAVENFVDLVELLMRPLPLPPAGKTAVKLPSSDFPEASSQSPQPTELT